MTATPPSARRSLRLSAPPMPPLPASSRLAAITFIYGNTLPTPQIQTTVNQVRPIPSQQPPPPPPPTTSACATQTASRSRRSTRQTVARRLNLLCNTAEECIGYIEQFEKITADIHASVLRSCRNAQRDSRSEVESSDEESRRPRKFVPRPCTGPELDIMYRIRTTKSGRRFLTSPRPRSPKYSSPSPRRTKKRENNRPPRIETPPPFNTKRRRTRKH